MLLHGRLGESAAFVLDVCSDDEGIEGLQLQLPTLTPSSKLPDCTAIGLACVAVTNMSGEELNISTPCWFTRVKKELGHGFLESCLGLLADGDEAEFGHWKTVYTTLP